MNSISDESVMDLEKRRYYIQSYEFTLLGFLIDENEFEVMPAVNRVFTMVEFGSENVKRGKKLNSNPSSLTKNLSFPSGTTIVEYTFEYSCNILIGQSNNITSYDLYINDNLYGTGLEQIYINNGDVLKLDVIKLDNSQVADITLNILLV